MTYLLKQAIKYPVLEVVGIMHRTHISEAPALYRIREAKPPEEYFANLRKL